MTFEELREVLLLSFMEAMVNDTSQSEVSFKDWLDMLRRIGGAGYLSHEVQAELISETGGETAFSALPYLPSLQRATTSFIVRGTLKLKLCSDSELRAVSLEELVSEAVNEAVRLSSISSKSVSLNTLFNSGLRMYNPNKELWRNLLLLYVVLITQDLLQLN